MSELRKITRPIFLHADNPQSIEALKTIIRRVICELEPQLWKNVIEKFDLRIGICKRGRGGHLPDAIFHL